MAFLSWLCFVQFLLFHIIIIIFQISKGLYLENKLFLIPRLFSWKYISKYFTKTAVKFVAKLSPLCSIQFMMTNFPKGSCGFTKNDQVELLCDVNCFSFSILKSFYNKVLFFIRMKYCKWKYKSDTRTIE